MGVGRAGQDFENFSKKVVFLISIGKTNLTTFAPVRKRWAKSTNDYPLKQILLTPMTVIGKARVNFGYNSQTDRMQSMKTS